MDSSNVLPLTEVTDVSAVLQEFIPGERVIPVWLSLEDLDIIDDVLQRFAASAETPAGVERHVADLQKHFAWVRSEFTTSRTRA